PPSTSPPAPPAADQPGRCGHRQPAPAPQPSVHTGQPKETDASGRYLHQAVDSVRRRLLVRADTTPDLHHDEHRTHAKQLILAVLDWVGAGEHPDRLPAAIANLD